MQSRVTCKLREVISEVTGKSRSDYVTSLREEHREGLLLGRKAYAIDNVASGITLFMPWRLHGPIEALYRAISGEKGMAVMSFQRLVNEASLFPKPQNSRKKSDILDYIISKVVVGKDTLDFEEFIHALFLIAKYKASVMRVTEQCAFNHLLATLIKYGNRVTQERPSESVIDVETPSMQIEEDLSRRMASISISRKNTPPSMSSTSSPMSFRATSTMRSRAKLPSLALGSGEKVPNSARSSASPVSNTMKSLSHEDEETNRAEQLFKMAEDRVIETCEVMKREIATLREQLQKSKEQEETTKKHLSEIVKLKDLRNNLMEELKAEKEAAQEYKNQLEEAAKQADESRRVMQQIIDDLESEVAEAKAKQQASVEFKARCQQIQNMLALQPEYETILFSVFVSYRNDELVNGELVMSEVNCIAFCIDFALDEIRSSGVSGEQPVAKMAYREVASLTSDGYLTYSLFKEFLLRLAELMDPQSTQKRAFRLLLSNNIFNRIDEQKMCLQQHLIAPDEYGRLPFDNYPMCYDHGLMISSNPDNLMAPEGYMDVEGRMWIEQGQDPLQSQQQGTSSTPRFPE